MTRIYKILYPLSLLAASLSLAGCSDSEDLTPGGATPATGKAYVSLTFTMPQEEGGRAAGNPTGGEDGDGREKGQDSENTISSAVAFFFHSDNGVNSDASTLISEAVYFDSFEGPTDGTSPVDKVYKTVAKPTALSEGTYNVLVVANPGTDWWTSSVSTLGQVRDHLYTTLWQEDEGRKTNFVMSSEKDADVTITKKNSKDNPATTEVDVERVAARVDYKANGNYEITDEDGNPYNGSKVEILGGVLTNNLTSGSYTLKRVSTLATGGTITYLGDETVDGTSGLPNNWVIDPTTGSKGTATFGVSWKDANASDPNWWDEHVTKGTSVTVNEEEWNILGYTQENITAPDETKHEYNTAVVFQAKFHPASGLVPHYEDGATFFKFGDRLYASMEDLMEDFEQREIADLESAIESCASWDDVKAFIPSLHDGDPSGYKAWLAGQAKEPTETWSDAVKASLKWSAYMRSQFGYSAKLDGDVYAVTLDQDGKKTAELLAPHFTRTYEDAKCYYTWWLRHANDGDDEKNSTMEYAVVRNNIYKLSVTSVSSLGGYIPTEEDHGFVVRVYVKDWTLLKTEEIDM